MTSLHSFCPQTNETMWRQSWERCQTMESELSAEPRDMSQGALRQLLEQLRGQAKVDVRLPAQTPPASPAPSDPPGA